jgi:hypothetical protein
LGEAPQLFTRIDGMRYADAILDANHDRIIVVREDHTTDTLQPINTILSISTAGDDNGQILVSGNDFYSTPRLNLEGTRLVWLTWNHPNMPWDGTEMWVAELLADGTIGQRTWSLGAKLSRYSSRNGPLMGRCISFRIEQVGGIYTAGMNSKQRWKRSTPWRLNLANHNGNSACLLMALHQPIS